MHCVICLLFKQILSDSPTVQKMCNVDHWIEIPVQTRLLSIVNYNKNYFKCVSSNKFINIA